jgi:hypothetical protein
MGTTTPQAPGTWSAADCPQTLEELEREWAQVLLHEAMRRATLPVVQDIKRHMESLPNAERTTISDLVGEVIIIATDIAVTFARGWRVAEAVPETMGDVEARLAEVLRAGDFNETVLPQVLDQAYLERVEKGLPLDS